MSGRLSAIKAYELAIFEILRDFVVLVLYYASVLSLHVESTGFIIIGEGYL